MFRFRRQAKQPPINPALLLQQAIRQYDEAQVLEVKGDEDSQILAYKTYTTIVKTFLSGTFNHPGPYGQERLQPLDDRIVILELIDIAKEACAAFNRLHAALPSQAIANVRAADYYGHPHAPINVTSAVAFLSGKLHELGESKASPERTTGLLRKTKVTSNDQNQPKSEAPVLPPIELLKECVVCLTLLDDTAPARPPTSSCTHAPTICTSCISQFIASSIEMRGVAAPVACPDADCTATLSYDDVKFFATDEVFIRYDMLTLRHMMRNDTSGLFVWCQNPNCYSGQLHPEGSAQPIVTCIRCSARSCYNHSCLYHEGVSCKQYDDSLPFKDTVNRVVSRVAIWWNTRNCPGCFQPIEKNGGCRHMTCRCNYSFTWYWAPIHYRRLIPFIRPRNPAF